MPIATRKNCALLGSALLLFAFTSSSNAQFPPSPTPIGGGSKLPPPIGGENNAPVIISLQQQQVAGQKFRIFGSVADETPQSCGVVISGAASDATVKVAM